MDYKDVDYEESFKREHPSLIEASDKLKEIYADTHSSRATVYMDGSSPARASTRPFRTSVKYIRADIAEARIAKLEDALRWYGDERNYDDYQTCCGNGSIHGCCGNAERANDIESDKGQRAREALKDDK